MKIGVSSPWITLDPSTQHTLIGDLILSNQFESLSGVNDEGITIPLAAKSWKISEDFKVFEFEIDTSRRFSDGTHLAASYFKTAWEYALQREAKSTNNSVGDVLYLVEGYENFAQTGELSGIQVINKSRLRIQFTKPFRMALDHLQGTRFAAVKIVDGKYLGTGKYIIDEHDETKAILKPNPYADVGPSLASLEIVPIHTTKACQALQSGQIDVFVYGRGSQVDPSCFEQDQLTVLSGFEALHEVAYLNVAKGRLFEDLKLRRAIQFLFHESLENGGITLGNENLVTIEPQLFLPLQKGRIDGTLAKEIINEGQKFVPKLIQASQTEPLIIYYSSKTDWLIPFLKEKGIKISNKSENAENRNFIEILHKTQEPDLIPGAFSVAYGDPDGLYHKIGKQGAIMTRMSYLDSVGQLMEDGRQILGEDAVDMHYREVSKEFLRAVPFIHLGFSRATTIYRSDLVETDIETSRRNQGHLHIFRFK